MKVFTASFDGHPGAEFRTVMGIITLSGLAVLILICTLGRAEAGSKGLDEQASIRQDRNERPIKIDLETPRNFGYSLGDQITLIARIHTPIFYRLETSSLPKPGPLTDWLQLVSVVPLETVADYDYALAVTYQVFKHVPLTTELTLPPLPLHFKHQGKSLTEVLPAWTFSYNPLIPGNKADDQIEPEPEMAPTPMKTAAPMRRLLYLIAAISALLLYILWFYGKVPFLERYSGAFGKACRTLKLLKKQPPSQENSLKALQCFHHALNELSGETVFAEQLPLFFQRFPKFTPLREKTEDFFRVSQQIFFTGKPEAMASISIAQVETLCLRYRKLERGSKWI